MFKIIFAKTYDFAIMEKYQLDHVKEDYFIANENVFCVADGVTRDRIDGKPLDYPKTLEDAKDLIANYPNPSGAATAAKTCTETFVNSISLEEKIDEKKIFEAVKKSNMEIAKLNANRKIDFGTNDYFGCVAVGGKIIDNTLYCFSICDCKIKILDNNFDIIFDTARVPDNMALVKSKEHFILGKLIYRGKWNWNNIEYRKHFRKKYRNNNWFRITNRYTFGVLTGEKKALPFVHTYTVSLDNAKYILAYSDGCDDCIRTKEQIISVISNPEQIKEEIHEKTLVIYERV